MSNRMKIIQIENSIFYLFTMGNEVVFLFLSGICVDKNIIWFSVQWINYLKITNLYKDLFHAAYNYCIENNILLSICLLFIIFRKYSILSWVHYE